MICKMLKAQMALPDGTTASPAATIDRVYISDGGKLHSLGLDLASDTVDILSAHGSASPAVGPDGTLYVLTNNQFLVAYPK